MSTMALPLPITSGWDDPLELLPRRKPQLVHKEETIYSPEDPADSLYLVVDGAVKISRFSENGRETVIEVQSSESFFGSPHDSALVAGLSLYLAKAGRLDRALALTREVERLNPLHNLYIHGTRALVHYERGEFEQARAEASWHGRGGTASIVLTASYGRLGRKAEAREMWQQLLDSRPDFAGDPLGLLHRELFREDSVARYVEGLRLAGIELE